MFSNIFVQLFWSSFGYFFLSFSKLKVICYLWHLNWFKNETCLTLETSKMEVFAKIVGGFSFWTILQKAPSSMYGRILSSPLKLVKLFPICLLNLINTFHYISVLCTVKSKWPSMQHICLITKIIIVFPNHVFL